jgi:hypothetical protein
METIAERKSDASGTIVEDIPQDLNDSYQISPEITDEEKRE